MLTILKSILIYILYINTYYIQLTNLRKIPCAQHLDFWGQLELVVPSLQLGHQWLPEN